MVLKSIVLSLLLVIVSQASEKSGKELFSENCAKCHANILGVTNTDGYENSYITPAPYVADLVEKLKAKTGSKEAFKEFIKEYIQNPDKRKSLYGKKAIKKFGLMPSLKGALSEDEIVRLADYLYDYKKNQVPKKEKQKVVVKQESHGEKLFKQNCAKCHANILGVTNSGGHENSYITPAPYVTDLVAKLKEKTGSKEKFTKFIREYIQNPDKRKSLYGKKAIKKFGLMPSLKGALNDNDINDLADYLYSVKK
jgi:mono/diheme cytochrome c family protein